MQRVVRTLVVRAEPRGRSPDFRPCFSSLAPNDLAVLGCNDTDGEPRYGDAHRYCSLGAGRSSPGALVEQLFRDRACVPDESTAGIAKPSGGKGDLRKVRAGRVHGKEEE